MKKAVPLRNKDFLSRSTEAVPFKPRQMSAKPREVSLINPFKKLSLKWIVIISLIAGFFIGIFFQSTFVKPQIVNLCGNIPEFQSR